MDNHEGNALYFLLSSLNKGGDFFMPKRLDLVGKTFDELTVVEMLWNYQNKHRTYCRCIGLDGKEYIVRQDALQSGVTHTTHGACSGGMPHDITGQRFGRLIAIEPIEERATNGGIRWKCQCDCGNIIYPTMNNLKRGHTTSCGCAIDDYVESLKIDIIGDKYGLLTVIEELPYKLHNRRAFLCECECGNYHAASIDDLRAGHTLSCGCLSMSKMEYFIKEILDKYKINYDPQHSFDNCKNIKRLRFDFYLIDYNICIEYDGEQHFRPIDFWGGEKGFQNTQLRDEIKNQYCKDNNIGLIRIPYYKTKEEIEEIIKNITSPATITA